MHNIRFAIRKWYIHGGFCVCVCVVRPTINSLNCLQTTRTTPNPFSIARSNRLFCLLDWSKHWFCFKHMHTQQTHIHTLTHSPSFQWFSPDFAISLLPLGFFSLRRVSHSFSASFVVIALECVVFLVEPNDNSVYRKSIEKGPIQRCYYTRMNG